MYLLSDSSFAQKLAQNFADKLVAETITLKSYDIGVEGLANIRIAEDLCTDTYNNLWIATEIGIYKYNGIKCRFYSPTKIMGSKIADDFIKEIDVDDKENILFRTNAKGWISYDSKTGHWKNSNRERKISHFDTTQLANLVRQKFGAKITALKQDLHQNFWIGLEKEVTPSNEYALIMYDTKKQLFYRIVSETHKWKNIINALAFDKIGNVYISSWNEGVYVVPFFDFYIQRFFEEGNGASITIKNNRVWATELDNEYLYVGSANNGGLTKINLSTRHSISFTKPTLCDNDVFDVLVDKNKNLWVGTNNGLAKKKPYEDKFFFYFVKKYPDSTTKVWDIYEDNQGRIWAGTYAGLYIYDTLKNNFIEVPYKLKNEVLLKHYKDRIWVIQQAVNKNALWIGTYEQGLIYVDVATLKATYYTNDSTNIYSLVNNRVSALAQEENGNVWVGMYGGGLQYLDQTTAKFYQKKDKQGLITDEIHDIVRIAKDTLLLVCKDIVYYNPTINESCAPIYSGQYDQSPYNICSIGRSIDDVFWIGTNKGVVGIKPDTLKKEKRVLNLQFDELKIEGKTVLPSDTTKQLNQELYTIPRIEMDYGTNFSLGFTVHLPMAGERIAYNYWIDDGEPIAVTEGVYEISFNQLSFKFPDRDYVLHLTAIDKAGYWKSQTIQINIHIKPPFWGTWWFALLVLIGLITVQHAKHRSDALKLKKEVKLKTAELTVANNELQRQVNEIEQLNNKLKETNNELTEAKNNIEALFRQSYHDTKSSFDLPFVLLNKQWTGITAEDVLKMTKDTFFVFVTIYTNLYKEPLTTQKVELHKEIELLIKDFEQLDTPQINFFVQVNSSIENLKTTRTIANKILILIFQLLQNAWRYNLPTEVTNIPTVLVINLLFTPLDEQTWFLKCEDNGTGFSQEINEEGGGFTYIRHIIGDLKGSTLDYGNLSDDGGAFVSLKIPLNQLVYISS
jgi:ligand-binding sensor domain-containing protein/two-component sensor histidine kinase